MSKSFDVIFRGAEVYDGAGNAAQTADVGVQNDRIAAIGSLDGSTGALDIDANGLALCPGFIDVHTHDDFAALAHPDMAFKSRGGVTTCIVGNCGFGAAPFAEATDMLGRLTPSLEVPQYVGHAGYAEAVNAARPGVNIGVLAGHGTIRMAAVGSEERLPTDAEMRTMKDHLDEALEAGVLGMSTGLIYDPGRYAKAQEITELAGQMRGTGAVYATHMRDEGLGLADSVREAIAIGAGAGVPVQISHHKASGRESWGMVSESLALIEAAQLRGENVHADQYPYTAGSTSLQAVLENGAFAQTGETGIGSISPQDVVVASSPGQGEWEGKSIAELATMLAKPALEAARSVVAASSGTTVILHMMSEEDVRTVMRHESTMIGSDGIPTLNGRPHPRLYNSFARVLGHYARDENLFDMATAVYRMCGMAATKFGLMDRGHVAEGAYADLVLFDPATILDKGTFDDPNHYPGGIHRVFVNGVETVVDDQTSGRKGGRVLTRAR